MGENDVSVHGVGYRMEFLVDECDFLLLAWSKKFLVVLAFVGVFVGLGVAPYGCTGFVVFPSFLSSRFVVRRLFTCCGCEVCGILEWDRTEPNRFDFGSWDCRQKMLS